MEKKSYRIWHTDKSGLRTFVASPIWGEDGVNNYLDYIEQRYGKSARDNAVVEEY
jgi:hypothetical protein